MGDRFCGDEDNKGPGFCLVSEVIWEYIWEYGD